MSSGYRLGIIQKELKPKVERGNCSVMVLCVCVRLHVGLLRSRTRGGEIRNVHYCWELYYY